MPRKKQYEDDASPPSLRLRKEREQLQAAEIARRAELLHHTLKKAAAAGDQQRRRSSARPLRKRSVICNGTIRIRQNRNVCP